MGSNHIVHSLQNTSPVNHNVYMKVVYMTQQT